MIVWKQIHRVFHAGIMLIGSQGLKFYKPYCADAHLTCETVDKSGKSKVSAI